MQVHTLRYSCEIFTTKTCYVENKNIRLSIEKMRKMMLAMLRMRMCCCRISGGGSSNRLFTTGGFIIVPPSWTIIFPSTISPLSYSFSCFRLPLFHYLFLFIFSTYFLLYFYFIFPLFYSFSHFLPVLHNYPPASIFFLFSPHLSLILSPLFPLTLLLCSYSISPIHSFYSVLLFISAITFTPFYTITSTTSIFPISLLFSPPPFPLFSSFILFFHSLRFLYFRLSVLLILPLLYFSPIILFSLILPLS